MCDPKVKTKETQEAKVRNRSKYQRTSCEWCCRQASGLDEDGDLECAFCWSLRRSSKEGKGSSGRVGAKERENRIKAFLERLQAPCLDDLCAIWKLSLEACILRIETCGLREYSKKGRKQKGKTILEDLAERNERNERKKS